MILDDNLDAYGDTLITNSVGTSKMSVAYNELSWLNDRFGSWVICKQRKADSQLLWWDTISTKGIDESNCAKVSLLTEYF